MAEPFDYNRDIAPEKNTFDFLPLSSRIDGMEFTESESTFLNRKADQEMMPQLDLMMKLRGQIQKERAADLAFETGMFEFRQRKKGIRQQKEYDEQAENLLAPLGRVVEDPDLSPTQKIQQIGEIQLKNSRTFANSPIAQASADAALRSLSAQIQEQNKKDAKRARKRAEQKGIEQAVTGREYNRIQSFKTPEELEAYIEEIGDNPTLMQQENIKLGRQVVKRAEENRKLLEQQEKAKTADEKAKAREKIAKFKFDGSNDDLAQLDRDQKAHTEAEESATEDQEGNKTYSGPTPASILNSYVGRTFNDGSRFVKHPDKMGKYQFQDEGGNVIEDTVALNFETLRRLIQNRKATHRAGAIKRSQSILGDETVNPNVGGEGNE